MNRALIWKEFREQGLIVAALVVLGAGILIAAGLLMPAPTGSGYGDTRMTLEPRKLAIVLLLLASGVVVGGTLFAGEREQGTFPYLEQLPVPRWRVWLGKILAGLILVVVAAGLLFAVAAGVGILGPPELLPFWALISFTLALAAYTWGALGSSFARTSLAACGLGLLMAVGLSIPIYMLCWLGVTLFERAADVDGANILAHHPEYPAFGTLFGLVAIPLMISAWIYTSPDRNRFARDVRTARGGPVDRAPRPLLPRFRFLPKFGIKASLWVVARQNLTLTIVLVSVTIVSGLSLLQPTLPVMFVWPVATLLLGTVVGVTGWSDEQNAGSFRFWAERRMPVGKLWLAKVAFGLALVALLVVLLAVPSLIGATVAKHSPLVPEAFQSRLMMDREFPTAEYLWLWPIYGFAFGHLAGLLFRKAAVGTAVGLMTGGAIVAFWLPSLFAGGIHWYQLWLPPLLALATARSLVWSWALDQLGVRRALLRLGAGGTTIALAMVGGLAYRIFEVPEEENSGADWAYRATIPPFETNDAGREIRRGGVLFNEAKNAQRSSGPELPHAPLWDNGPSQQELQQSSNYQSTYLYQLSDVLVLGWPADRADADAWLDAVMANGWAESLVNASRMPLGTVEDPTELLLGSPLKHLDNLQGCEVVLLARGLQLQARGKPEAFVEAAAASLSLVRNLRNKSLGVCNMVSLRMEANMHRAIARWLEKLGDRPDLLKEMLKLVRDHDAVCPKLLADGNLPEQTVLRNTVNSPTQHVKQHLAQQYPGRNRDTAESTEALENEVELVAFAWAVPWERERLRRLVGLGNVRGYTMRETDLFHGLPGLSMPPGYVGSQRRRLDALPELERNELAHRRASILLLALRLHQAEKGKLPASLDALVPKYLPAVPLDPFDDQPFRYRVSAGETIQMELLPPPVPATPATFGALLGGAVYEIRQDSFLYPLPPVEQPSLDSIGALLGGVGHELESDPLAYGIAPDNMFPGGPRGIAVPAFRMLQLPAGRGILWSIGPDRIDDGGKRLAVSSGGNSVPSGDLIFIVPPPAENER